MEKIKLLLVEDDLFIRELYEHALRKAGFEVISAVDGQDALTKVLENPALVLLDIMLPKIHGIDVLKKLKADERTKDIPVVMLTNLGQESIIKEAFKLGALGYLLKMQITPSGLTQNVKKYLSDLGKI